MMTVPTSSRDYALCFVLPSLPPSAFSSVFPSSASPISSPPPVPPPSSPYSLLLPLPSSDDKHVSNFPSESIAAAAASFQEVPVVKRKPLGFVGSGSSLLSVVRSVICDVLDPFHS
ncbi:unnamed protein product [Musa hybrid cultivar]